MSELTLPAASRRALMRRALGLSAGAVLASGAATAHHRSSLAQREGWQQIGPGVGDPSPRWDHSLAAHDASKSLYLFGGRDGDGAALGDTWQFSRTRETWTLINSPGPAPRFGHAVATDQDRELLFLFGGQAGTDFFNDLWQLDMGRGIWTQIGDGNGAAIAPRYGTSMVLTRNRELVVSHGFTFDGRFDDTWSYDLEAGGWAEISPGPDLGRPLKRCLHRAVWADHLERMVLFGGCSSGFGPCPQGDLWSFEPAARIWTERTVETAPTARSNPALVYDGGREQILLVGGLTEAGYAADLWSLAFAGAGNAEPVWIDLGLTGPSPRASHDAAMTGPWLYLFGGYGDSGVLNDLWELDVRGLAES